MSSLKIIKDETLVQAVGRFLERPEVAAGLAWLHKHLPGMAEVYVAGGALRNIVIATLHGRGPPTRDIDLFIGGLDRDFSLPDLLHDQQAEPTDLKGVRWHPGGADLAFDLCLLPDFLVIDTGKLEPSLESLLASIDFTMNAIVYDDRRQRLVERGCRAAVREQVIDFNCRLIPDKGLIAYRILHLAHKTGFALAAPVFEFVRQRIDLETLTHLKGLLQSKLGKTTAGVIMAEYNRLCHCHTYADYRARERGTSA